MGIPTPGDLIADGAHWVANHLGELAVAGIKSVGIAVGQFIFNYSDIAVLVAVVLVILGIMGSKRAWKGVYWTGGIYFLIKVIGSYFQ